MKVQAGNRVIGAVGVGGVSGAQLDGRCALAALHKVTGRLQ